MEPTVSLVIFGAGNDAIPLVQIAATLSWIVTIVDGRSNYAIPERFPLAKQVITSKPENSLQHIRIDNRTAIILMTHNYNYDACVLKQLLPLGASYIGVLGPKKRLQRMLDDFTDEGIKNTPQQLESVFGPAGLDIGSENADEIALSIIAEMQAVLKSRTGTSLRYKTTIHNRQPQQIVQQTLP
nr:XdhC family protein [Mucilaginibacter sp. FT3.2]